MPTGKGVRDNFREYDPDNDWVTTQVDPMNNTTSVKYDAMGDVKSVTLPNVGTISDQYDDRNRLHIPTDALGQSESWTYWPMGEVKTHSDRKGQTTSDLYDALERLSETTYADDSNVIATYDAGNRLLELNDSADGILEFGYNGLDEMTESQSPQGTVKYQYDAAGRRQWMLVGSQAQENYTYDNANRLTKLAQGSASMTQTWDNADRLSKLTLPNGVSQTYGYDSANEATSISYAHGSTSLGSVAYTYDLAGRRNGETGTGSMASVPDTLPTATTANGVFDKNNRQTGYDGATLHYDADGNLNSDGTDTYQWNARNQLVKVVTPAGTSTFTYDALGRRQSKSIDGDAAISYLYDGLNPVEEIQGTTVTPILTGLGVDQYFARPEASGEAYLLTDALGSTIGLTDSSGALIQTYSYGPYGEATASSPGTTNPYQYTGRENDGDGLYYYRARYYSPALKRFVSEDPTGFNGGQNNFYAYVEDDPISSIDPMGLMTTMTCRQLGGWESLAMFGARHCSDFVWHWETDPCTGEHHKVIDAQYSLSGGDTRPNQHPNDDTHRDDLNAFNNPGGTNSNYNISPPGGVSQNAFDQSVINAGNVYSQGPYNALGPNSNTSASQIIINAGGTDPGAWGAVGNTAGSGQ